MSHLHIQPSSFQFCLVLTADGRATVPAAEDTPSCPKTDAGKTDDERLADAQKQYSELYMATHVTVESSLSRVTFATLQDVYSELADTVRLLEVRTFKALVSFPQEKSKTKIKKSLASLRGCIISLVQGFIAQMLNKYAPFRCKEEEHALTMDVPWERSLEYAKLYLRLHRNEHIDVTECMKAMRGHVTQLLNDFLKQAKLGRKQLVVAEPGAHPASDAVERFCHQLLKTRFAYFAQTWLPEHVLSSSSDKVCESIDARAYSKPFSVGDAEL